MDYFTDCLCLSIGNRSGITITLEKVRVLYLVSSEGEEKLIKAWAVVRREQKGGRCLLLIGVRIAYYLHLI